MCKRIHFNQENNFIDQRYEYSPSHVKYFISDYFNVAVVSVISEYEEEINDEIHDVVIFYNDIELYHDMQIDFNEFRSFF